MRKEKCEENFEEKTNSDTNKGPDNKSNSKKTTQDNNFTYVNIFEAGEEAKNETPFNANRIEKELEKVENNQSSLTDVEEKKDQIKSTAESESNTNGQNGKTDCQQINNIYQIVDLKIEVNNSNKSLGQEASPKNIEIKEKKEVKKCDEEKSSINNEVIIINPDVVKKENEEEKNIFKAKGGVENINNILNEKEEKNNESGDKMSLSNSYNNEKEQIQPENKDINNNQNNIRENMSISSSSQNQNHNGNNSIISQNNVIISENNSVNEENEPEDNNQNPDETAFETVENNNNFHFIMNNNNNNVGINYGFEDVDNFNFLEENGMNNYLNYANEENNNNDDIFQDFDFGNIESNH